MLFVVEAMLLNARADDDTRNGSKQQNGVMPPVFWSVQECSLEEG